MIGNTEVERGQVGIGTLIVFIAMVLVAAIAAGVLINTAGSLQSQASDTGTETQQAVANQIEVIHAVGYTETHSTSGDVVEPGNISYVDLTVKKSAGSDVIDLKSTTVQYTSEGADETLVYDEDHDTSLDDFVTNGGSTFATMDASESPDDTGVTVSENGDALTNTDDRIIIRVDVDTIEDSGFQEGDSATIVITDQSGAQFSYGLTAPSTFQGKDVVRV